MILESDERQRAESVVTLDHPDIRTNPQVGLESSKCIRVYILLNAPCDHEWRSPSDGKKITVASVVSECVWHNPY